MALTGGCDNLIAIAKYPLKNNKDRLYLQPVSRKMRQTIEGWWVMNHRIIKALFLASSLVAGQAYALGLGKIALESNLNEPLVARIQLVSADDVSPNEVIVKLASQADFDK